MVQALLQQTNLYEHRRKALGSFSGGMKQRFGIAQALLGNPRLIIVDEPTAGLDPEERVRFHNLLSAIGENIIVILSTHIVSDVSDLCRGDGDHSRGPGAGYWRPAAAGEGLEGKVWRKSVAHAEVAAYRERFQSDFDAAVRGADAGARVERPAAGSWLRDGAPDLEDLYFATIKGFSGASHPPAVREN